MGLHDSNWSYERITDYSLNNATYVRFLEKCYSGCWAWEALLLFTLANPLVLRPRFWSAHVVARSFAIDAMLLIVALGLLSLRRWAALLASLIA